MNHLKYQFIFRSICMVFMNSKLDIGNVMYCNADIFDTKFYLLLS